MHITAVFWLFFYLRSRSSRPFRICPLSCRYWDSVWNYPGSGLPGLYNT
jgi:hypothetical protein